MLQSLGSNPCFDVLLWFEMVLSLLIEFNVTDKSTTIYIWYSIVILVIVRHVYSIKVSLYVKKGRSFLLFIHMHSKKYLIFYSKIGILFSVSHLSIKKQHFFSWYINIIVNIKIPYHLDRTIWKNSWFRSRWYGCLCLRRTLGRNNERRFHRVGG